MRLRTLAVTDTLGFAMRYGVNNLGQTTQVTDQLGRITLNGYDGTGTLRWSKRPDGQLTVYQVDGLGRTVATIVNYINGQRDATDATDQDSITKTSYDLAGRRIQQSQRRDPADQVTSFDYDNADRLITVTENATSGACPIVPCNVITQYQYDRAGNRIKIIDPLGHARSFAYDAANEQTAHISASDAQTPARTTTWAYDNLGRMTNQVDPRGASNDLSLTYDGVDRLKTTTATNLGTITNNYDALGR
ncbi:MAG TPA: hypothetical protein VKE41_06710, partial [Roseiflexaceae bacterium]|nr:hypothetical protein [Roseiflexaceae bacterium]